LLLFIASLALTCYLLASPLLSRLFYPFHYREQIIASADMYRVDPLLVAAVIHTESGFRQNAVSARGARGLMQVMPSTAEWVAERIGFPSFSEEMLFEPHYNIQIGTWYLADLIKQFDGSTVIALAAYNGGRGEVDRWLHQGIWDGGEANLGQIPFTETRGFVMRVLKTYRRYNQLYSLREEKHAYGYIDQG
jgi:soluble lytic murein transglycosylase